jgi:hypothetical protein
MKLHERVHRLIFAHKSTAGVREKKYPVYGIFFWNAQVCFFASQALKIMVDAILSAF